MADDVEDKGRSWRRRTEQAGLAWLGSRAVLSHRTRRPARDVTAMGVTAGPHPCCSLSSIHCPANTWTSPGLGTPRPPSIQYPKDLVVMNGVSPAHRTSCCPRHPHHGGVHTRAGSELVIVCEYMILFWHQRLISCVRIATHRNENRGCPGRQPRIRVQVPLGRRCA